MAAFAPFETAPCLAVGVSGGADSMALVLLADAWARTRGGSIVALSVDHGLRASSAGEAAQVARWLATRGIAHRILAWPGAKPITRLQAAARDARYRLLCDWCRGEGVLHLLVGHHAQDQAETVLNRLVRGSASFGLAGMSALVEVPGLRLLRPLLATTPDSLRDLLRAHRQPWIEDPSNRDRRFARARLRAVWPALQAGAGQPAAALIDALPAMAAARVAMEDAVAALLARVCRLHPAGFVWLDRAMAAEAPAVVVERALAGLVAMIGGGWREPSPRAVRQARDRVLGGAAAAATTIGRCRLMARDKTLLICRERRDLPGPCLLPVGGEILWDGRFRLSCIAWPDGATALEVRPIAAAAQKLAPDLPEDATPLPEAARATLPVMFTRDGMAVIPSLGYNSTPSGRRDGWHVCATWHPRRSFTGAGYFLAS
jgi:tRNA(Ile)-lysidine synthase